VSTGEMFRRHRLELGPLTNSLASAVRWRYRDYASFLLRELEMLSSDNLLAGAPAKQPSRVKLR
jgi:hypothetical protein